MLHRFKVERPFPVWWREKDMQLGEIFEVVRANTWHMVGGGFYRLNTPLTEKPDFSGARLQWLLTNKYISKK